jgi:hypothetical protein
MLNDAVKIYKALTSKEVRYKDTEVEKIIRNEASASYKFQDIEKPVHTQPTDVSISFVSESLSCFIWSMLYLVNLVEIFDLTSAFSEGFDGYSIGIQMGSHCFETDRQDVNGKQVVWDSLFEM